MQHYNVIVCGAGPAGNAAAFRLAQAGAKVALLEKYPLPRHKTCGGGMPMTVAQTLALDEYRDLAPDAFVETETRFMRHTWNFGDPYLAPMNPEETEGEGKGVGCRVSGVGEKQGLVAQGQGPEGRRTKEQEESPTPEHPTPEHPTPDTRHPTPNTLSLWMVQRSIFDNALAQRAARAGAELRDGLPVRSVAIEDNSRVRVKAEGKQGAWEATADYLIGADGANGIVARTFNLRRERTLAIAIEAEVPHTWGEGHPDLRPDVCHLEYGAVPKGYAWIFPKGDHLNVGAGVFRPRKPDGRGDSGVRDELHTAILGYLQALGVPRRHDELTYHAHPLPVWNGLDTLQTRDNRVLLAGDAAGLIGPIFGDGILHALKSGQIAAHCLLTENAAGYTDAIAAEFRANFDTALQLARFFYQWSGLCYQHAVKRPTATHTATRLLAGDLQFTELFKRVMRRLRNAMLSERHHARPKPKNHEGVIG